MKFGIECTVPVFLAVQIAMAQPMRVLDLDVGETDEVSQVKLLEHSAVADNVRDAVRVASVRVKIKQEEIRLVCGAYRLPVTVAGVQIDCAVTKDLLRNSRTNPWGLRKDARLRLWPAGSPLLAPGTYTYPVKQRWFATDTQMANEPSFVDGSEEPSGRKIYYHYGLDIGGAEGLTEVVSATDGRVVVRGKTALPEYVKSPYTEVSYDGVIVLDDRGWFHWYFHLASIDTAVELGKRVRIGQRIGLIGKEGSAGCWSHLHYEIRGPQPSGEAGIVEGYAFLREAYWNQYHPKIVAVARPHSFAWVGEPVTLDGSRSWVDSGQIVRYQWRFSDGTSASGPTITRKYRKPGTYSEILQVTDSRGLIAYDFAVVQTVERQSTKPGTEERVPPTIHASSWPALNVRAGDPVTFLVRTCRTTFGHETWDFGDGSAPVTVTSDGCAEEKAKEGYARTQHVFKKPGDYIVRVERANERGEKATAHLWVPVLK
ncbi:MAG TPA: PKD domain-containing protein [Bryobacteraceae bacterium]|nr:PKD domain-containing protein [Bryobacteraceae bacterium]